MLHKRRIISCIASHLRSRVSAVGVVARLDGPAALPVGARDFVYSETSREALRLTLRAVIPMLSEDAFTARTEKTLLYCGFIRVYMCMSN